MVRVLWFGLGRFGRPMAEAVLDAGHTLLLTDTGRARQATAELRSLGAQTYTPGEVVDACATCLPRPEDVDEVIRPLGPEIPLIVDFSTGLPEASVAQADECARRGIRFVDAPVSGSQQAARRGELTVWAGSAAAAGDHSATLATLLDAVGANVFYMGRVGDGSAMKLVNQAVHISTVAALGDGLRLAAAQGLDLDVAVRSMSTSSAQSAMLDRFGATIVAGDFSPRFAAELALKDLRFAHRCAESAGAEVHTLPVVLQQLERLVASGNRGDDFTVLARIPPK